MDSCVEWLSSEYVVALCSFLGIISFFTSAYAAYKSSKIDKTLNRYKHQEFFKEEQTTILEKLDGFIEVTKSGNLTKSFVPDIVCQVRSISSNHKSILTIKARLKLFFLLSYLKKPYDRINSYDLAIKIGDLKGFLEKKEV